MAAAPALSTLIDWAGTGWRSSSFVGLLGLYSDAPPMVPAIDRVHPSEFQFGRGRSADFTTDATGSASLTLLNDDDAYTPDRNWCDNPSFEVDLSGWSIAASPGFTFAASSISRVADGSPGAGLWAGEVDTAGSVGTPGAGVTYTIPYRFQAGVAYSIAVGLRSISGTTSIEAGIGASATDQALGAGTITGTWTRYTWLWTPIADSTFARFFVRSTVAGAAVWRVDAIQINPGASPNPYLEAPTKGQLLPGRPVHISAAWGSGIYPQFFGFIERLTPNYADRTVNLTCYDPFRLAGQMSENLLSRSRTHREIRIDALNGLNAGWRNLLEANPSFETNVNGWTPWLGSFSRVAGDAAPLPNAGTACGELVVPSSTFLQSPLVFVLAVAGMTFRASLWLKLQSGSGVVTMTMVNQSNIALSSGSGTSTTLTPGVWTRLTGTWTANGADTGVRLVITTAAAATVRVDAAMITIGPEDRAFVTGLGAVGTIGMNLLADPSFEIKPVSTNWGNLRTNFIDNPSFEVDLSGWSSAGDAFVPVIVGNFVRSTLDSVSGVACAEVDTRGLVNSGIFYAITGTFRAGVAYTASAYVRRVTGTANGLFGIGSQGTPSDKAEIAPSITTSWTRVSVTWTPLADRTDAHLYFGMANDGIVHRIDAVLVVEGSTVPVYGENFAFGFPVVSATRITTDASSGIASMEVTTTAVNGSGVRYMNLSGTFYAGIPYTFICSVKSVSGNTALALGIGSESNNSDSTVATFTATKLFAPRSVTWTPSADRVDVVVFLRTDTGSTSAIFRVDGCAVYPGENALPYEPPYAALDAEDGRAPDNASSGTISAILGAVNAATFTRHWIRPVMTAPFWRYVTESRETVAAKLSAEAFIEDFSDASGFDIDANAIINVQRIQPSAKYLDANTNTQPSTWNGIYDAADAASIVAYGRRDGQPINSDLLENKPNDVTIQRGLGDAIVARYKDPHPRPAITVVNRWPSQLQRELNDLITLTFARLRITSGRYLILRLETTVSEAGQRWETKMSLEESPY